ARELRRTQDVPVAIINSSWGGTPIRTWMSLASLQSDPPLTKLLLEWESALARHRLAVGQPERLQEYYREMKEWEQQVDVPFRAARKAHEAAVAAAKASGQPVPPAPKPERPEPEMPDPIAMPASSKRPSVPTVTYNAMIAPLAPFALKGVLWYQGEADVSRGREYRDLLPRLIGGWRAAWDQKDLPFLIVQLPGNGRNSGPAGNPAIAFLREAQSMALRLPATGMAVTLDIGDASDVHPDNKVHVGQRLSLLAREMVYREDVIGSGPVYRDHAVNGSEVRVRFDRIGGGLAVGNPPWRAKGAEVLPSDRIVGFSVAGEDRKWFDAEARLDGDAVIVTSSSVPAPVAVRYGWGETPSVNLANREGLPAAPFRTDDWDL
ncbi:MAG TPA: sialate O-acetylesterase, partial [Terrimicrobiaceae bacterium]|nr:sialate O-acetylesterase [Terrimicrobiaceae bacterium]